ncbi:hypothetical protein PS2_019698 [Malus domestica]
MRTRTNSICWNPMEPINFTAANEDSNCYSFDCRKFGEATCVHMDHVSAVRILIILQLVENLSLGLMIEL